MQKSFYTQPPTENSRREFLGHLQQEYRMLKVFPIGQSVLGREIPALCLGHPGGAALFVGATHGLEWLTTMVLLRFCEKLLYAWRGGGCLSDIDVGRILPSRSLVVVPCLNPDGVEIALGGAEGAGCREELVRGLTEQPEMVWQANANGVDLNHNFDAGWKLVREQELAAGITGPSPTRYGGPHPHSEPETAAIATFCRVCRPRSLYALHSQGEEIYWKYGEHTPQRSKLMGQILACSSGYTLSQPEGMASHGGLKDWFIEKLRRPGFTIEMGRGKNPLGLEQLDDIYHTIEEMLMLAVLL